MLNIYEVLDITESQIFTKLEATISINKIEYREFITEYEDRFQIPGILDVYFPELDDYTQIVTGYNSIGVMKSTDYFEDNTFITIKYSIGEKIIEQEFVNASINLPLVKQMLSGKLTYIKNPEIMINLLHQAIAKSDIVHLEIMLSNIFRDNSSGEPCRHTGDYSNSSQIGVLQLGKTDSWLSAIAFQNIDQGIMRGLINQKAAKMNPIEKVLNEEFSSL